VPLAQFTGPAHQRKRTPPNRHTGSRRQTCPTTGRAMNSPGEGPSPIAAGQTRTDLLICLCGQVGGNFGHHWINQSYEKSL
jgi:hypothetical protein